jgi:hypothetical protein
MAWELTDDLERFMTAAEAYLRSRPVQHTTLLTLISALRRRGLSAYGLQAPFFGAWRDHAGVVAGVLLQTPPRPVLFGEMPPEAVTEAVGASAGRSAGPLCFALGFADRGSFVDLYADPALSADILGVAIRERAAGPSR